MSLKQLVGQSKFNWQNVWNNTAQLLKKFLEIMTDVIKAQRQNDKWKVLVLGLFMTHQ